MVRAFLHGVGVTGGVITEVSSRHDSGSAEPTPGCSNLSSVASHRHTRKESTASGSIGN